MGAYTNRKDDTYVTTSGRYIRSAQSKNLRNLEIALCILRIPRLSWQSEDYVTHVCNLKIASRVRNLKIASCVRNLKIASCVRNLKIASRVRNLKIASRVRNLEIASHVRNLRILPVHTGWKTSLINDVCLHRRHIAIWKSE